MANSKNRSNRALYIYTALIFLVAILLIILSFFSMSNRDQKMNENEQASSITEKASTLSEENKNLAEENQTLKDQNEQLINYQNVNEALLYANSMLSQNVDEAKAALDAVNYDELSDNQKVIYDNIANTEAPQENISEETPSE